MRRRKKIHAWPVTSSRWMRWATQLTERHGRLAIVPALQLRLHATWGRTLIMLHNRWLSFHNQTRPQLKLSINACSLWNTGQTNVYAPQMKFLKSLTTYIERSLKSETERRAQRADLIPAQLNLRRAVPTPFIEENVRQLAMTLAVARTTTEHLSTSLQRNFSMRHEMDSTEVARRLTQRLQRVHEVYATQQPMALRRQAPVAAAPKGVMPGAMPEQASVERRGHPQNAMMTAMTDFNVEQIANQVLKQIDRRVIARRERMGQI